jgi:hypothetical protein
MKIHPVRAELFHADGQTDMSQLTAAVRMFCEGAYKQDSNYKQATVFYCAVFPFSVVHVHLPLHYTLRYFAVD